MPWCLTPLCILQTPMSDDMDGIMNRLNKSWHFVCDSSFIYATPSVENRLYSCCLDQGKIAHFDSTSLLVLSSALLFELVPRLLAEVILSNMSIDHLFGGEWVSHETSGPPGRDLDTKVILSGYVVLSSSTFMVSDADETRCFLHDMVYDQWSIVTPLFEPNSKLL